MKAMIVWLGAALVAGSAQCAEADAKDTGTNYLAREAVAKREALEKELAKSRPTPAEREWLNAEIKRLRIERAAGRQPANPQLGVERQAVINLEARKRDESNRVAQASADQAAAARWKQSAAANDAKLLAWQQERAARGEAGGQYELGMRYLNGKGVTNNPALALEWLSKAAAQGHTKAKAEVVRQTSTANETK